MILLTDEEFAAVMDSELIVEHYYNPFVTELPERACFYCAPGNLSLMEFEWGLFLAGLTAEFANIGKDGVVRIVAHKR